MDSNRLDEYRVVPVVGNRTILVPGEPDLLAIEGRTGARDGLAWRRVICLAIDIAASLIKGKDTSDTQPRYDPRKAADKIAPQPVPDIRKKFPRSERYSKLY